MKALCIGLSWIVLLSLTVAAGLQFGMPWGASEPVARGFALVPVGIIVVAHFRGSVWAPSWLAFGCGIMIDLLTQSVLGYWALIYLTAGLFVGLLPDVLRERFVGRLFGVIIVSVAIFAVQFVVSWGVQLSVPDWRLLGNSNLFVVVSGLIGELAAAALSRMGQLADELAHLARGA